jgi:GT2 family glycosyltransferase
VAIVISSYQAGEVLHVALEACQRCAPRVPIYLVDNGSTDGSVDAVRGAPGTIHFQRLDANRGFTGGMNVGIRAALEDGADYVFFVSHDIELRGDCLPRLVEFLESHPTAAAIQPSVLLPDGRAFSLGNSFHYLGFGYAGGNGMKVDDARRYLEWDDGNAARQVPYCSGAAVLVRGGFLRSCGLFEEQMFLYHDDLELFFRARSRGFDLWIDPAAEVIHHYQFSRNTRKWYFLERNRHWVWMAYFKARTLALLAPFMLACEATVWAEALRNGWPKEKAESYMYWAQRSSWRKLMNSRRAIQHGRTVNDREMLRMARSTLQSDGSIESPFLSRVANPASRFVWRLLYPLIRW